MKPSLLVLAVAILVAAASASSRPTAAHNATALVKLPPAAPAGQQVLYGHIKSLTGKGGGFELRFDPAWLLSGATAQRAAVEDGVVRRGEAVPNDNYTRDESHRLLTFRVPATARATLVGRLPSQQVAVPVAELAQILRGKNPKRRPVFAAGNQFGFWIRVSSDTVRSLDQQYHP